MNDDAEEHEDPKAPLWVRLFALLGVVLTDDEQERDDVYPTF